LESEDTKAPEVKKKPKKANYPLSKRPIRQVKALKGLGPSAKGNIRHLVTPETKELVRRLIVVGLTKAQIASILGISEITISKHYKHELSTAAAGATAAVAQSLFDNAMKGNVAAPIFWMKTRGGWSEKRWVELTGKEGGPIEFAWAGEVIDAVVDDEPEDAE